MNSEKNNELDKQLADLKSELESVKAPSRMRNRFTQELENRMMDVPAMHANAKHRPRWVFISLAATVAIVSVIAIIMLPQQAPDTPIVKTKITYPSQYYVSAKLSTPIAIHSLASGPQVHYVNSQMIQYQNRVYRVAYFKPSQEN